MLAGDETRKATYRLSCKVHIEALPNAVNFIDLGEGKRVHDENGFSFTFTDYGVKDEKTLELAPITMASVHTEYDYRGKGINVTKIQFATEYLYEREKKKRIKRGNKRG